MNEFITFKPQDTNLPTYVRLAATKTAFQKISAVGDVLKIMTRLSQSLTLLIAPKKEPEMFDLYTEFGTFVLSVSNDSESFGIVDFYKTTLLGQNNAMKNGICFRVSDGVIIQIKLSQPYNLFYDICNGKSHVDNAFENRSAAASINTIREHCRAARASAKQEAEEEELPESYSPEKKLAALLQTAENYSILESELQEQKAATTGNIAYLYFRAVEYERIDRQAYELGILHLDEKNFKKGGQIEIEDLQNIRHSAEIFQVIKPEDGKEDIWGLRVLFSEQISVSDFASGGWISLSFSSVIRDVQMAAIEKIRAGEAPAKYLDTVIGKRSSAGFESKDLRAVDEQLAKLKHMPNPSQVNAIKQGINARDVYLVMGPPGTGKTTVILEWVKYFVNVEHKRVLVSSQNNKAVDNVLTRIADEPDIDVIRIGSENKLQSELIPYMFENKVAGLRESIAENCDEKIALLDSLTEQFSAYSDSLNLAADAFRETESRRREFQRAVQAAVRPHAEQMKRLLLQYQDAEKRWKKTDEKIRVLKQKIRVHEARRNPILRFFFSFGYKSNLRSLILNRQVMTDLRQEIRRVVEGYNQASAEYEKSCETLRDREFRSLYEARLHQQKVLDEVAVVPGGIDNIWGLFSQAGTTAIRSTEEMLQRQNYISEQMRFAEGIKEGLMVWKHEIVSKQNYALNEIVLESVDLVGATCIGVSSQKRFASLDFDVTIIDEAGQIQVHNALVPMSVSNKLIMLGDHKQIPPTVNQELALLCEENGIKTDLLEMSLFERMYGQVPEENRTMLDTQYRMPAQIADILSEWFYDGKYYSPDSKRNAGSLIPELSKEPFLIIDTSKEKNRRARYVKGSGCDNACEARIIADIMRKLAADPDFDLKEVGMITGYKLQVQKIIRELEEFIPSSSAREMAASLNSFQGQERDLIFYSFAQSGNTADDRSRIGFLSELRMLNVALSRCKKMLILVGDMDFLTNCRYAAVDEFGEEIYEGSDKQFSDFVRKMLADVEQKNRGERIFAAELRRRLGIGEQ